MILLLLRRESETGRQTGNGEKKDRDTELGTQRE